VSASEIGIGVSGCRVRLSIQRVNLLVEFCNTAMRSKKAIYDPGAHVVCIFRSARTDVLFKFETVTYCDFYDHFNDQNITRPVLR
jgi:hypothetical protein